MLAAMGGHEAAAAALLEEGAGLVRPRAPTRQPVL